ncbi:hypothetical protein RJ639_043812 [Escallonia herrerae]|uniref:J domain-containing protein n=1 Tax=Escallonia herrerae TaxID=1293975 RepID=A0AA89B1X0_9ASTE|nr:hypothetical protein RJ639_043812 [Escallonia herrerae]
MKINWYGMPPRMPFLLSKRHMTYSITIQRILQAYGESGTLSEIKKAYKQLARKYDPYVSLPERTKEYTKTFIRVQETYETLSDPQTRALYDIDMSKGLSSPSLSLPENAAKMIRIVLSLSVSV